MAIEVVDIIFSPVGRMLYAQKPIQAIKEPGHFLNGPNRYPTNISAVTIKLN
jgi:hypothetical protein